MIEEEIQQLSAEEAQQVLLDFMNVYLDKGFGTMSKTDIETLMYHVFKKHGLLTGKCFDDSFALQISEAKARKLIYDAQVKYTAGNEEELLSYLRKYIGSRLQQANLVNNGEQIKFAIEDKYVQVALNAKLRANNMFADTSFNRDIITMDVCTFRNMVQILVPNDQRDKVLIKVPSEKALEVKNFLMSVGSDVLTQLLVDGIKCMLIA